MQDLSLFPTKLLLFHSPSKSTSISAAPFVLTKIMFDYGALHFVRCCEIFFGIILDTSEANAGTLAR